MKYVSEIEGLLLPFPGRQWRVVELVRHVTRGRHLTQRERDAERKAVSRVLDELVRIGLVGVIPAQSRGGYAKYFAVGQRGAVIRGAENNFMSH